jgi:methionyl-tRNA formyltransferase
MRVVFMGTPDFAVPALEALAAAGHAVACVYTQPPRPAGRGQAPRPGPVHARALALGLPVRHPAHFREAPSARPSRRSMPMWRWWRPTG